MRRAIVLLLTENLCTLLDLCVDYYKSTERNDIKQTCASKSFEIFEKLEIRTVKILSDWLENIPALRSQQQQLQMYST